jgi:hypothetical protein
MHPGHWKHQTVRIINSQTKNILRVTEKEQQNRAIADVNQSPDLSQTTQCFQEAED